MAYKLKTPAEISAAFTALAKEIGPNCQLWPSVKTCGSRRWGTAEEPLLGCSIYPSGIGSGTVIFHVAADTWDDLLAVSRAKWAEHADLHAANLIKSIALAVISLTAEHGHCTDAMLRADFDAGDLRRHGEQAVARANEMAANGPFSIVETTGANAAEAA